MSANQRGDDRRDNASEALFALEPQQITIGREIGKGAFSVVYSGELGKKRVAVKCQPKDADGAIPPYVLKEVQILQKLQHPRLLEFIGACDNRKAKQVWILSEHADNGDIAILLSAMRKGSVAHVGWRRLALMALDAAQGVAFMHAQRVIHRDIKSSNILLDNAYRAKLCDFGFAMDMKVAAPRDAEDETLGKARRKSYCGTDAYMAPEMFLDEDYDESVDIFSFGVVLMELLCCRVANQDGFLVRLPQHKFRISVDEFRDALPASCPLAFARLAEQCVAFEPLERPKADAVVAALEELLAQKALLDAADTAPVELRPFTPLAKDSSVLECEPQMDDDDDDDYGSDDDDDDEDSYGDGEDDDDCCGKGDDTVDLDADEADHSSASGFGSEAVDQPFDSALDGDLAFCPHERTLPLPRPANYAGVLLKRNRRGTRAWSAKWFILDGGELHYSDVAPPPCSSASSAPAERTRASSSLVPMLSTLSLRDCRIWKTMEMPELCFHVINGNWKIKRELQATSRADLDAWMDRINLAIDYANDCALQQHESAAVSGATKPHAKTKTKTKAKAAAAAKAPRSGKQPETRCPESAKQRSGSSATSEQQGGEQCPSSVGSTETEPTASPEAHDDDDDVYAWLKQLKLEQYTSVFKAKGYASIDFIRETGIEKEDLNFLGIKDSAARRAITAAARVLRNED